MKHTLLALTVVAMLALSLQFAVAQDTEEDVSEETQEQAKIMTTNHGAKVRLLQLEFSLQKQIAIGERIIERAKDAIDDFDSSELEVMIEEMKELKEQAGSANTSGPTDEVVQEFVDLKHDAVQLSQQFRNETKNQFSEQIKNQIMDKLREGLQEELSQMKERIRNAIREHNSERLQRALGSMRTSDKENLVQNAKDGELTREQIMDKLREQVQNMTSEKRQEAADKMKELAEQNRKRAQEAIDEAKERFRERMTERVSDRLDEVKEKLGVNADLIEKRLNVTLDRLKSIRPSSSGGEEE